AASPARGAGRSPRHAGLPEAVSSIVPVVVGEAEAALAASRMLEDEGFLVVAIRPPTVPDGTARLRFAFAAGHPDDEIVRLADIVRTRVIGNQRMSRKSGARFSPQGRAPAMPAVFVTATGTDIGKTFVTRGLIGHFIACDRQVEALKPVVSGFDEREAAGSDPGLLLAALGVDPDGE